METYREWSLYISGCLFLLSILNISYGRFLRIRRQQELKQVQDNKNNPLTTQDILEEYKTNPGHKTLTPSERRFQERVPEEQLTETWNQEQSRSHTRETEPVRGHPAAVKEISRINRQLRQPSPQKSRISHLLHLLFLRLCIYIALPFLTLCIFCHSLRINLTESSLLEVEEESDQVEFWELDPV